MLILPIGMIAKTMEIPKKGSFNDKCNFFLYSKNNFEHFQSLIT